MRQMACQTMCFEMAPVLGKLMTLLNFNKPIIKYTIQVRLLC